MIQNIDGVIFDVDGTIWDSTEVVQKAWNQALREEGLGSCHVTADDLRGLFGLPMKAIMERVLPNESEETQDRVAKRCFCYEHEFLAKEAGTVYDGIEEMLRRLSARYPLYIVSNCQAGYIELMLDKTGFAPFFKGHLCPADTGLLKADNIRRIADENGLQNALYVGDTLWDESASREAGVAFAHAAYGFGTAKAPDLIIHKPTDLVDQLL